MHIESYRNIARAAVNGHMIIGTFAEDGPIRCSGLEIKRYSEGQLEETFADDFQKTGCIRHHHITPINTGQEFLFCSFSRKSGERIPGRSPPALKGMAARAPACRVKKAAG